MEHNTPLLVLTPTGRCCSTLLMRWLNTHPDIWIWGEPHYMRECEYAIRRILNSKKHYVENSNNQYKQHGLLGWIPNLSPTIDQSKITHVLRVMYEAFYQPTTHYWGFKEILVNQERYDNFRAVFPDGKFIIAFRELELIKQSYLKHKQWWPGSTWEYWEECYASLYVYLQNSPLDTDTLVIWNIDDELSDLAPKLERFLNVTGLNPDFLKFRVSRPQSNSQNLSPYNT